MTSGASAGPNPGTGRPQYVWSRKAARFSRAGGLVAERAGVERGVAPSAGAFAGERRAGAVPPGGRGAEAEETEGRPRGAHPGPRPPPFRRGGKGAPLPPPPPPPPLDEPR